MNPHGNLRSWSVCPRCLDPYDTATCPACSEFPGQRRSAPRLPLWTAAAPAVERRPSRVLPLLGLALPIVSGIVGLLIWGL